MHRRRSIYILLVRISLKRIYNVKCLVSWVHLLGYPRCHVDLYRVQRCMWFHQSSTLYLIKYQILQFHPIHLMLNLFRMDDLKDYYNPKCFFRKWDINYLEGMMKKYCELYLIYFLIRPQGCIHMVPNIVYVGVIWHWGSDIQYKENKESNYDFVFCFWVLDINNIEVEKS